MSPKPLTRQESQARTRQRLVTAAEKVFLKHGYHAASTSQIARAAGYTTGAVYSNFASKDELGLAVLERRMANVALAVQEELASAEPTLTARLGAVESLWENGLGDEQWLVLATEFIIGARKKPALRALFAQRVEATLTLLAASLRQQQDELGVDLPLSPERLATAVLGLGIGLSVLKIANPNLESGVFADTVALVLDETPTSIRR